MSDSPEKPPLLFATARSGSYPVYAILLEYLRQTRNVEGLLEFLNQDTHSCESSGGKIVIRPFPNPLTLDEATRLRESPAARDVAAREISRRLDLIAAKPENYFFKVLPEQVLHEHVVWLSRRFELIFLERRNLWEQLLSYLISMQTGQWYAENGIRWENGSIKAEPKCFKMFEDTIKLYFAYKAELKPKLVVTYEDFLGHGAKGVLEKVGLRQRIDLSRIPLLAKQNPPDKERAFSNLDELRSWFGESHLSMSAV